MIETRFECIIFKPESLSKPWCNMDFW